MKINALVTLILVLLIAASTSAQAPGAETIIQKTIKKLNSIKIISYDYRRELNYASEGFFNELKATGYLDLSALAPREMKFQFESGMNRTIYNGTELFSLDGKAKVIRLSSKPGSAEFESVSYLTNSPLTLKNVLPVILADKGIAKTVTEKRDTGVYVIEFVIDKHSFNLFGEFSNEKLIRKLTYQVAVSKDNFMPVEVVQKNSETDFIKTSFTNISEKPSRPVANTWFYSTYTKEYNPPKPRVDMLIKPGAAAPDLTLAGYNGGDVKLGAHKGKLVLLEFWIVHCGACIAAVPRLNELKKKYPEVEILAVNLYDTPEHLALFSKNNKPEYAILKNGEPVAKQYGVDFYPTVVLIGKDGKVIYSGVFDHTGMDALIKENLKVQSSSHLQKPASRL